MAAVRLAALLVQAMMRAERLVVARNYSVAGSATVEEKFGN